MKNIFLALLMFLCAAYGIWSVVEGIRRGKIDPMMRGAFITVERSTHPRWFCLAVTWNGFVGGMALFIGIALIRGFGT